MSGAASDSRSSLQGRTFVATGAEQPQQAARAVDLGHEHIRGPEVIHIPRACRGDCAPTVTIPSHRRGVKRACHEDVARCVQRYLASVGFSVHGLVVG
jgi:hypothetical protein